MRFIIVMLMLLGLMIAGLYGANYVPDWWLLAYMLSVIVIWSSLWTGNVFWERSKEFK